MLYQDLSKTQQDKIHAVLSYINFKTIEERLQSLSLQFGRDNFTVNGKEVSFLDGAMSLFNGIPDVRIFGIRLSADIVEGSLAMELTETDGAAGHAIQLHFVPTLDDLLKRVKEMTRLMTTPITVANYSLQEMNGCSMLVRNN